MAEPFVRVAANVEGLKVLVDLLKTLTAEGKELTEQIPKIEKDVSKIEANKKELEEAAKNKEIPDPEVSQQISDLENRLSKCTIFAKRYVLACKSMAQYATQKKIAVAIEEELQQGKFDTLKTFIKSFMRRLATCTDNLGNYVVSHVKLKSKAGYYARMWQQARAVKKNEAARAAKKRFISAEFVQRFAGAAQLSSAILPTAGMFVGSCLYLTDNRRAAITVVAAGLAVPAVLRGSLYSLRLYCERTKFYAADAFIENTGVQNMLERAQANISKLKDTMEENKKAIDIMTSKTDDSIAAINTIVTEYIDADRPLNTAGIEDVRSELTDFRSSMNGLLETIGNSEESLTSDSLQLVSNTVAQQPSDCTETEPDDANRVDLDTQLSEPSPREEEAPLPTPITAEDTGGTATAIGIGSMPPTVTSNEGDEWDKDDAETQIEKEGSDDEEEVKKREN